MLFNEVKGQLAKLLATENLVIEHKVCETASFNVETRTLILPIWDVKDRTYTMLVGHEVGHALYTPNDDSLDNLPCPKSYVNVTEDARIEKLMKRKFPGLTKDFYAGYQDLHSRDFFSVKDTDLTTMKLIDRINLYYKIGAHLLMPFDDSESTLRDAVGAAETFEEAIAAALAIYEFEKKKREQEQHLAPLSNKDTGDTSIEKSEGKSDEEATNTSNESDAAGDEQSDETGEEMPSPFTPDDLESDTDAALTEKLRNITNQWKNNETKYLTIGDVDLDYHIIPAERIIQECEAYWDDVNLAADVALDWSFVDNQYRKFKRECAREVNYLSKEFEMKKSAASYARETVSRTGVLDLKKLHTYKYNEDLFKKVTVRPDGKNHGLIFLLDWSGSMAEIIHDTYKQLLSLCLFCRKAGIPFNVYAFVNDMMWIPAGHDRQGFAVKHGVDGKLAVADGFFLLNVLSSDLNNAAFDKISMYLWRNSFHYDAHYGQQKRNWEVRSQCPNAVPSCLSLSGTPLNEAIACLQTIIPAFQRKTGAEKVHVSILTDGEAQWSQEWRVRKYNDELHQIFSTIRDTVTLRDTKNGRTYAPGHNGITSQLLRYMKGRFPQCNFLGFRVASARDLGQLLQYSDLPETDRFSAKRTFTRDKSVCLKINGYQELYFLNANGLNMDADFEVEVDATKTQIKNAFKKSLKGKSNNKKILSSFITQIA